MNDGIGLRILLAAPPFARLIFVTVYQTGAIEKADWALLADRETAAVIHMSQTQQIRIRAIPEFTL